MNNNDWIPIWGPLVALLRSRKVLVAIATLIVNLIIAYIPELEPVHGELMIALTTIGAVLVGAIAHEDGQAKKNGHNGGTHP